MSAQDRVESIDMTEYRRRLLGLADPVEQLATKTKDEIRELALEFVASLPRIFGDALDRKTLWPRIGSAIRSSAAKAGGDADLFVSCVCDHLVADDGDVAGSAEILRVISVLSEWTQADREAWLVYLRQQTPIVLVRAKERWEAVKKKPKDPKPGKSRARETAEFFAGIEGEDE